MRLGLFKKIQVPASSDLSRVQDNVKDAVEVLAADHDVLSAPVQTLVVTGAIPAGKSVVAFRGGAGQTLTLPQAKAQGASTAAIMVVLNASANVLTIRPTAGDTIDGGLSLTLAGGTAALLTSDGVNKWISGGTMVGTKANNAVAPGSDNIGALVAIANAAAQAWTEGREVLLSVDLAGNLRMIGVKSNNGGAPGATNLGVLPAIANAAAPAYTEGNQVLLSTDLVGNQRVREPESTLMVTATAAVNTGSTCTLPAAGAGLFHYITKVELVKLYNVVGVAAGAGVVITSTNLPGNPAWTTEQLASAAGTAVRVIDAEFARPLKSSVANTATTFVAGAQLQTIWRWNVTYYTGP